MKRTFPQSMVLPNMPLRRPSTSPGDAPVSPKTFTPPIGTPERPLVTLNGDGGGAESVVRSLSDSLPPMTVKLCNYCSQQGNLLCTRCKRTWYCSLACQKANWNAHRHLCMPSTPESPTSDPKETPLSPVGNGSNTNSKVNHCDVAGPRRVYLQNLHKNNLSKGAEVQATVVELRSPGRFFIHVQSPETMESLKTISGELQKSSVSPLRSTYVPDQREVCAVKFSLDQNWYRGMVQSVASDQKTASILYIDFGNEENVTMDMIKPLAASLELMPPCAVECRVAGIEPVTDSWTEECIIAVKQLVAGKSLTVTVVDVQESDRVHSVDVLLSPIGKNLSTLLVAQGYAAKVTNKQCSEQDIVSASLENFRSQSGGKNENAGARSPDPLTQGLGDSFTAVVTHLQSPDDIICQKLENASVIQELQLKLRERCCQAPPASANFRPAPGTVCCALFSEDNQWYRATVLAYSSEERVCVGYIDFGNSEEVDLGRLLPLGPELLVLPMQAIPCALAGVRPVAEAWSEDGVQMLRRTVCNRFLRVEILGESEGRALVTMVDEASDPQANVAEVLVATGYALPADPSPPRDAEAEATPGVEALEWSCVELPCEGQKVALLVSVIETPGEFYCNVYSTKEFQVLAELRLELTQYCEANNTPFTPTVGVPCCAMFSGDGVWYRGMVQEVCEGKARVFFVDYGNSGEVELPHLRVITPHLLRHPFQAIRCYLAGVETPGFQWSSESLRRFQALCIGHQLLGRVLSITEQGYGIELESGGQNVRATLFSEQLARVSGQQLTPASKETTASTSPPTAMHTNQKEHHLEMPKLAIQKEAPAQVPMPKEAASFPVDWRTEELPSHETFQPRIAAVVSPSLFYLFNPNQVDREQLRQVMRDLSVYCSSQASPSQGTPPPGAACCAQFSDKSWYRAVVLETRDMEATVLYADYGNSETVALSCILPIPKELLQLPFQICRCALQGKENFPVVWPAEVLELFRVLLSDGVLASKKIYDGRCNLLSVTLSNEHGQGHLNSMILEGLQNTKAQAKTVSPTPHHTLTATTTHKPDHITPTPKPHPAPTAATTQNAAGYMETAAVVLETPGPRHSGESAKPAAAPVNEHTRQVKREPKDPQSATCSKSTNGLPCCCLQIKTQIDNLEGLILSLMKQLGGLPN
ncbi:tudor domain-containing protein 1 isoform X3 [Osmerus mordax]|uniref:tudor domain-containing protein 1 isoform X3 n=1 Tax=Osmerus mordax TaxID=8014 RepID=UPI00350FDCF4